jgi:hypothetical protein
MKVLFAAYDAGPTVALARVWMEGGRIDWKPFLLNAGKQESPSADELVRAVLAADVVVVGMSSKKTAAFEIEVCQKAMAVRRPLVFFSDSFGTWAREWFAPFRDYVSLVTVVVPSEIAAAQALYPNAKVVATGNPAWEQFHEPYQMRDQKQLWRLLDARRTDFLILISGCKDTAVNKEMIETVLEAAEKLAYLRGPDYKLILSLHPGDTTPVEHYSDWAAYHSEIHIGSSGQFIVLPPDVIRGDVAVAGVDVVVTYNAASVALRAVAHSQAVVVLRTPLALARLRSESGTEENPLVPKAALSTDDNKANLVAVLSIAYEWQTDTEPYFTKSRADQVAFFPPVQKGASAKAIIAALEDLLAARVA